MKGKRQAHASKPKIITFVSRGSRFSEPSFSDLNRSFYARLDLNGNPFFSGIQPTGADSKYDYNRIALSPILYFADGIFAAYDYYRITRIETTFVWSSAPDDGVICGELWTAIDKDSREPENSNAYINRRNLQRREFTNDCHTHTVSYVPFLVDRGDDAESQDYIQPTERWWNTTNVRDHRWGCMRYTLIAPASNARYSNAAAVFVHHRVVLEVKGQKDVVTPSFPPAGARAGEYPTELYGKQGLDTALTDAADDGNTLGNPRHARSPSTVSAASRVSRM